MMDQIKLHTEYKKLLADTLTPVSIYLQVRDRYPNPILLESSDYHGQENSYSYICFDPLSSFSYHNGQIYEKYLNEEKAIDTLGPGEKLMDRLRSFSSKFQADQLPFKFISNGLFGYTQYDAVNHFEDIDLQNTQQSSTPVMHYAVYRFVIVVNHFKNELYIFEHSINGDESRISQIETLLKSKNIPSYSFSLEGNEVSNYTDAEFLDILKSGREHCFKGDVFQIVLSRMYKTGFKGDEFNVYRALRSINPSPYLFYFDYGSFKVFGSSPEAQIVVKGDMATIFPIAGTFKRTGNDLADAELARNLYDDPKENSEHVMLVDLARNDLSRTSEEVKVEVFKEIQYYSHVIHLVSKVTGKLPSEANPLQLVADTFPAGTLSGAPKYMAMTLIDQLENTSRKFYGGAIGYLGFNGDFNHAILIRSFVSENNQLRFQAGAGVVAKSSIESELQEVTNKLEALRLALKMAENV